MDNFSGAILARYVNLGTAYLRNRITGTYSWFYFSIISIVLIRDCSNEPIMHWDPTGHWIGVNPEGDPPSVTRPQPRPPKKDNDDDNDNHNNNNGNVGSNNSHKATNNISSNVPNAKTPAAVASKPAAASNCIQIGDTGSNVKAVQELLIGAGVWKVNVNGKTSYLTTDGDFGKTTLAAVKEFQGKHGLVTDGVVGPATINALCKANLLGVTDSMLKGGYGRPSSKQPLADYGGQGMSKTGTGKTGLTLPNRNATLPYTDKQLQTGGTIAGVGEVVVIAGPQVVKAAPSVAGMYLVHADTIPDAVQVGLDIKNGDWASLAVDAVALAKPDVPANYGNKGAKPGTYAPERELPRTKYGDPIPDTDAPHSQLGQRDDGYGPYNQAKTWEEKPNGKGITATTDIDFSDHTTPDIHPNPHQHKLTPNNPNLAPKGGYQRGGPEPLK